MPLESFLSLRGDYTLRSTNAGTILYVSACLWCCCSPQCYFCL